MRARRLHGGTRLGGSVLVFAAAVVAVAVLVSNGGSPRAATSPIVLWAVGDGPNKHNKRASQVASMIRKSKPADVIYLGDVYQTGSKKDFKRYYNPTYGKFASITYPTPGNHELLSKPPLAGYDSYWKHKRPKVLGKYNLFATKLGQGWRLLDLTSAFITEKSGNGEEDKHPHPQVRDVVNFVQADVKAHKGTCYIAMFHRPRFSAGAHGDQDDEALIWDALNGHTSMLLQGHEHEYFRLDLDKVPRAGNKLHGARSFVVGTGGVQLSKTIDKSYPGLAASWVAPSSTDKSKKRYYGALRLSLSSGSAAWQFVNLAGKTIDSGTLSCTPVS
jgi:acid phosphatase type 7